MLGLCGCKILSSDQSYVAQARGPGIANDILDRGSQLISCKGQIALLKMRKGQMLRTGLPPPGGTQI